jgi:hypothetical protein
MAAATVRGSSCAARDQRYVDRLAWPIRPNPPLGGPYAYDSDRFTGGQLSQLSESRPSLSAILGVGPIAATTFHGSGTPICLSHPGIPRTGAVKRHCVTVRLRIDNEQY